MRSEDGIQQREMLLDGRGRFVPGHDFSARPDAGSLRLAGAFYMGRDFTECGNVIRNNYFHDIARTLDDGGGLSTSWPSIWTTARAALWSTATSFTGRRGR